MDGHELIEARFSDSNHLNVMTLWKDKDNNVVLKEPKNGRPYVSELLR